MPLFEEKVLSLDNGYLISWKDLQKLANSLDDIDTILVIASSGAHSYKKISANNFIDFFCKVAVFDSTS